MKLMIKMKLVCAAINAKKYSTNKTMEVLLKNNANVNLLHKINRTVLIYIVLYLNKPGKHWKFY